jgi:hypothetical protein
MGFDLRAVELHGQRMWEHERVVKLLAFMQRHGLNTLVLHESDLVHEIVYPRRYFDPYALWSDLPSRRGENAIFNNRAYFGRLLELAADHGVSVWVNVKEIGFSDEVLSIHPEVIKNGVFCPSEPFWAEYIEAKTSELFDDFPRLAGMVVSFGSQESRASRVQNRCQCELCRREPLADWYARMIEALHGPIRERGRQLAIRDFAYKPADHRPLIEAVGRAPQDIVFCIKAMPHDFYVTFPDNPALGALPRRQFVEYDVMGQFFGWGLMPCLVVDDIAQRVPRWERLGVSGAIWRIEWERINDLDAMDTLAEANLIAAAAWSRDERIDAPETCRRWLAERGWDEAAAPWLAGILQRTLPIVRQAAYMNDAVSADNSMLPRSIQRAWWGMDVRDSLAVWDPSRADDLILDRDKAAALVAEKDRALADARRLVADIARPVAGLDERVHGYVRSQFAHVERWVEGLGLCAKVCIAARRLSPAPAPTAADLDELAGWLAELQSYAERTKAFFDAEHGIPHQVFMLVDPQRALDVAREGRATLEALRAKR